MVDSPINPYQPPKAFLGALEMGSGKISRIFSILYYVAIDLVILWFLFIDLVFGLKIVTVFNEIYEGMGSKLPWITRFGLHPFTVKIFPFILLASAIVLHIIKFKMPKFAKLGLLIVALSTIGIYYAILFGMRAPIDKFKKSYSYNYSSGPSNLTYRSTWTLPLRGTVLAVDSDFSPLTSCAA